MASDYITGGASVGQNPKARAVSAQETSPVEAAAARLSLCQGALTWSRAGSTEQAPTTPAMSEKTSRYPVAVLPPRSAHRVTHVVNQTRSIMSHART